MINRYPQDGFRKELNPARNSTPPGAHPHQKLNPARHSADLKSAV